MDQTNYPVPEHESGRQQAVINSRILESLHQETFQRISTLAATVCEVKHAFISVIDEDKQFIKATVNLGFEETPRKQSFCQYTIMGSSIMEVRDTLEDTRFRDNPAVQGPPYIRFYAGVPLIDEEGHALGSLCVTSDEPHKLNAIQKETLRLLGDQVINNLALYREVQEAKLLRNLIDLARELSCLISPEGYFLRVNDAFSKILGFTAKELLDTRLFDLVHPEEHGAVQATFNHLNDDNLHTEQVCHIHTQSGGYKDIHLVIVKDLHTGNYFVIARDISDITRRGKLLRLVHEQTRTGGFEINLLDNEESFTPGIFKLFELDEAISLTIETLIQYIQKGKSRDAFRKAYYKAVRKGVNYDLEVRVVTSGGQKKWMRATGLPEMDEHTCVRIIGTFQDITSRKVLQNNLVKSKQEAQNASAAKSEFLANMSHEIRTPLNAVLGFTDLVLKTELNDVQKEYLNIAKQSGVSLLNIVNDILDFSKIEAGKLELNNEYVNLTELCSEAVNILSHDAESKGLELLLNIPPDLPDLVWIDSVRLKQILVNLLSNAIKFTEIGEVELKVILLKDHGEGVTLQFTVRDTGIGIKPARQKEIFKVFTQEDASTTKKYGGTGLGLSISNNLLKLMDSQLQLSSTPGEGSTFYFDLDLKAREGDQSSEDLSFIQKALITDNNKNNRYIQRELLVHHNIETVEAEDGMKAFEKVKEHGHFDIILVDYHMPFIDGLETIQKLVDYYEENGKRMPYFILSHSSVEDEALQQAGKGQTPMIHRMTKPIDANQFYRTLAQLPDKEALKSPEQPTSIVLSNQAFTILVAEDNPVNMLLIQSLLKQMLPNAELIKAVDGNEAVKHCRTMVPDLILMDLLMPDMNGYEATRTIRNEKNCRKVPIIAVTAGNVQGEKDNCLKAGMNNFITKPLNQAALKSVIAAELELSPEAVFSQTKQSSTAGKHNVKQLQVLNQETLFAFTSDDKELAQELFNVANAELKNSCKKLSNALNSGDQEAAEKEAHKLKGTTGSLGLETMAEDAKALMDIKKIGLEKASDLAAQLLHEVDKNLKLMRQTIETL